MLSPEHTRELADLRRRAYGPGTDPALDAAGLSRLHDLEDRLVRSRAPIAPAPHPSPAAEELPSPVEPSERQEAPDVVVAADDETPPDEQNSVRDAAPRVPLGRRIPRWVIAVVALGVGVAAGAWIATAAAPRPDAVLSIGSPAVAPDEGWERELNSWGLDPGSLVPFGTYEDVDVWSLRNSEGAPCLLLSKDSSPLNAACTIHGIDPILDWPTFDVSGESQSWLRFVLRGTSVEVWSVQTGVDAQSDASS